MIGFEPISLYVIPFILHYKPITHNILIVQHTKLYIHIN